MPTSRKPVAVVTPVYRTQWRPDEEIAFRHLKRHLGRYDHVFVAPRGLDVGRPGSAVTHFDPAYFRSPQTYSALLIAREFYEAFRDYEYVLIYQLDALVFSDQLLDWCARGFDYIGAPWLPCVHTPHITTPTVGNGGFSLRRVESCLRVLKSPALGRTHWVDPEAYWATVRSERSGVQRLLRLPRRYLKRAYAFNSWRRTVERALAEPELIIEDVFWSRDAAQFDPAFRVAPVEEAVRFAFEGAPRECFRMTGGVLPFGCHAWDRLDRAFWEPYLEPVSGATPVRAAQAVLPAAPKRRRVGV